MYVAAGAGALVGAALLYVSARWSIPALGFIGFPLLLGAGVIGLWTTKPLIRFGGAFLLACMVLTGSYGLGLRSRKADPLFGLDVGITLDEAKARFRPLRGKVARWEECREGKDLCATMEKASDDVAAFPANVTLTRDSEKRVRDVFFRIAAGWESVVPDFVERAKERLQVAAMEQKGEHEWNSADRQVRITVATGPAGGILLYVSRPRPVGPVCKSIPTCCASVKGVLDRMDRQLIPFDLAKRYAKCSTVALMSCGKKWEGEAYVNGIAGDDDCSKIISLVNDSCAGIAKCVGPGQHVASSPTPSPAAPSAPKPPQQPPPGEVAAPSSPQPPVLDIATLSDLSVSEDDVRRVAVELLRRGTKLRSLTIRLNTRGLRWYKQKDYKRAAAAFETGLQLGPTNELLMFNRACVAGLLVDAADSVRWLTKLKALGTARALRLTAKALRDKDFDPVRADASFKAFISANVPQPADAAVGGSGSGSGTGDEQPADGDSASNEDKQ